jgi:hypothetical protein
MLKSWSITTTVRNPERLREFLVVLQHLAGQKWDNENQKNYQKLLIKHRLYGYGSPQFYNGLSKNIVDLINDTDTLIDDKTIEKIITLKDYKDFAMRGRQSLNPLTKFGFAYIDNGIVQITELGNKLIENSQDFGDVFLKSFIKWQIPNPASQLLRTYVRSLKSECKLRLSQVFFFLILYVSLYLFFIQAHCADIIPY